MDIRRSLALLTGAALLAAWSPWQTARAQADTTASGWLEGTVTFGEQGGPAGSWTVTVIDEAGNGVYTNVDAALRGLYTLRGIKPGTYEVRVTYGGATEYRPQRIFGVVVRPGVRTT